MLASNKAYLYAIAAVLCWSTVATAFKFSLAYIDIYQLLFYACLSSSLILITPIILRGELHELYQCFKKHSQRTLLIGAMNPVIYYLILFASYDLLPAQIAQPINYAWSIVLTFMTVIFLRQKPTGADLCAGFICLFGVAVVATKGSGLIPASVSPVGVLLAVLSTFIWAYYWILNLKEKRSHKYAMCLNFLIALPFTAVICSLLSSFSAPLAGIAGALYAGVFEMGLAFIFWSKALRLTDNAGRINSLIFLSPLISLQLISWILAEPILTSTYVGVFIIIIGLASQKVANNLTGK